MFNFTVYRCFIGIMSGFCSMQNPYFLPKMFNFSFPQITDDLPIKPMRNWCMFFVPKS